MKTTFLSVAMLVASAGLALAMDIDPTIAVNQPCVSVKEGTAEVLKDRNGVGGHGGCPQTMLVKGYVNVCKGETVPGQKTPLPTDGLVADQICPPNNRDEDTSYWYLGGTEARGPFASREMCVAAAHAAAPSDRRFWSSAEKKLWEKYDWQEAQHEAQEQLYNDQMAAWFKTNQRPGKYVITSGKYKNAVFETTGARYEWVNGYARPVDASAASTDIWNRIVTAEWPTPPENLEPDSYKIIQECAPVHGWLPEDTK